MMGLYDMYAWAGNQQALEILLKWAHWFSRWTAQFTREQFDGMLDVETGGMLEVWADLYGITGEKEHYELIKRYDRRRLFDPLLAGKDVLTNMHANTTIPEIHGAARFWEVTGEDRYRDIVEAYWRCAVTDRGYFCTGGQNNGEFWIPPGLLSTRLGDKNQEYCTVYHMMRLADYLLRWTGDAAYDDYWERNLYNGSLCSIRIPIITYFLPIRSSAVKKWERRPMILVLPQHTHQAHSVYPHRIFLIMRMIILSQYILASSMGHKGHNINLTLSEDSQLSMPAPPIGLELKITCTQPTEFTSNFACPGGLVWPELMINGKTCCFRQSIHLFRIQRWFNDTVQITPAHNLTTSPLPDLPDTVAFMEDPVVLAGILE
jgi:DUF1680 family protein